MRMRSVFLMGGLLLNAASCVGMQASFREAIVAHDLPAVQAGAMALLHSNNEGAKYILREAFQLALKERDLSVALYLHELIEQERDRSRRTKDDVRVLSRCNAPLESFGIMFGGGTCEDDWPKRDGLDALIAAASREDVAAIDFMIDFMINFLYAAEPSLRHFVGGMVKDAARDGLKMLISRLIAKGLVDHEILEIAAVRLQKEYDRVLAQEERRRAGTLQQMTPGVIRVLDYLRRSIDLLRAMMAELPREGAGASSSAGSARGASSSAGWPTDESGDEGAAEL